MRRALRRWIKMRRTLRHCIKLRRCTDGEEKTELYVEAEDEEGEGE
jgi:hypothetical protein